MVYLWKNFLRLTAVKSAQDCRRLGYYTAAEMEILELQAEGKEKENELSARLINQLATGREYTLHTFTTIHCTTHTVMA